MAVHSCQATEFKANYGLKELSFDYTYRVVCDSGDGSLVAAGAPGVSLGDAVVGTTARCKSINASTAEKLTGSSPGDRKVWKVEIHWDNSQEDKADSPGGADDQNTKPDDRTPEFSVGSQSYTVPFQEKDLAGVPLVAKNGQPFEGLEREVHNPVLTWRFFKPTLAIGTPSYYVGAVNDDTWNGIEPYKLKCTKYDAKDIKWNDLPFVEITISIEYKSEEYWHPEKVLNAGTYQKGESMTDPVVPIKDKHGKEVTHPVPLNNDGKKLLSLDPADLIFLEFQKYRLVPFVNILNGV